MSDEVRDKSLALTALEDVLMRANRGIFAVQPVPLIDDSNFDNPDRVSPRN